MTSTASSAAPLSAPVSVKAPKWDPDNAIAWFAILDAQFVLSGITVAATKFYHSIAALPPEIVGKLDHSIISSSSYTDLKAAVIKEVERTKPELFHHLLDSVPVGKPSQYIKDMRRTAESLKLPDYEELLKHRLVTSQPAEIAAVLMSQANHLSASQLGELADQMLTLRPRTSSSNAVIPGVERSTSVPLQQRSKHTGLTPFREGQRQLICRSHIFYGERARSCRPWCKWPGSKPMNQHSTAQPSRAPSPTTSVAPN